MKIQFIFCENVLKKNMEKTNNILENLKKYFSETSRKKVLEDWKKTEKSDEVGGITVENLISHHKNIQENGQ